DRYSRLNLSVNKGNSIKEKLIENKFIYQLPVSVRKGKVTLLQIELKGQEYLRLRGDYKQVPLRYGGLIHQFWIDRISTQLRDKGFEVNKEHPIGKGKTVDLFAQKDNRKTIIEVETGKSDYMGNYEKLKGMKDCEIVFVFTGRRQKVEFEEKCYDSSLIVSHVSKFLFL
ncbi:MAG: hypothetical protein KO464_08610, partial [Candidatus Methanofastidiosum sp.]|nr:hypothetical protein [Methanofastidiosum sp.]